MKNEKSILKKVAEIGINSAKAGGKTASWFTLYQAKEPKELEKYIDKK